MTHRTATRAVIATVIAVVAVLVALVVFPRPGHAATPSLQSLQSSTFCARVVATTGPRLRIVRPRGTAPRFTRVLSIATCEAVAAEAERQDVPVAFALALAAHESNLDPSAIGSAGELGPLQAKAYHLDGRHPIVSGVAYLAELLDRSRGDTWRALGAYRCGWAGSGGDGVRVMPSACREYAQTVSGIGARIRGLV